MVASVEGALFIIIRIVLAFAVVIIGNMFQSNYKNNYT